MSQLSRLYILVLHKWFVLLFDGTLLAVESFSDKQRELNA